MSAGYRTLAAPTARNPIVRDWLGTCSPHRHAPTPGPSPSVYLITRRCTQRQLLLRPDAATNNAFLYCLIDAALRCQICEPRRNLRPRVAAPNQWARIEALLRNRAFVMEYADARARWRDGAAAVLPSGTYWLQRFASVPVLET